jgi:HAD superfamily hydrolase (TIGR01484 family)
VAKTKLVAFDLDGTLIGRDLVLSPRVMDAVGRMLERGIAGCIATGRMYRASLPFARKLGFESPIICYQGAAIIDPGTDEILQHSALPNAVVRELDRGNRRCRPASAALSQRRVLLRASTTASRSCTLRSREWNP